MSINQIVCVKVNDETFALNATDVECIIRVTQYSKVPKTPEYFIGISNFRGDVLPIIDLHKKLGYDFVDLDNENSRLVVVSFNDEKVALLVASLSSVLNSEDFEVNDLPTSSLNNIQEKFIKNIIKTSKDDTIIQLLDLEKLIDIQAIVEKQGKDKIIKNEQIDKEEEKIEEEKFITFLVNGIEYGISVFQTNEILRYSQISEIPGLPNYAKGVFSVREEIIPVISASLYFNRNETIDEEVNKIIILNLNGLKIGMLVDSVNEVLSVNKKLIENIESMFQNKGKGEVEKVIKLDNGKRMILLISPKKMFNEEDLNKLTANFEQENSREQNMSNFEQDINDEIQVVTFKVGEEIYGFTIDIVQEINRYVNVTKVPKTPKFVEGIINLRGDVIPLVDIRKRFEMEEKEKDEFTRLIIININDVKIGFVVDSVEEVLRISKNKLENVPAVLSSEINTDFITNIIKVDEDMIMILDAVKIFSSDEYDKLEKMSKKTEE